MFLIFFLLFLTPSLFFQKRRLAVARLNLPVLREDVFPPDGSVIGNRIVTMARMKAKIFAVSLIPLSCSSKIA